METMESTSTMQESMSTMDAGAGAPESTAPGGAAGAYDGGEESGQAPGGDPATGDGQDTAGQGREKPWHTAANALAAQRRREAQARQRERAFREVTEGINDPRTGQPFANEEAWRQWKRETAIRAKAMAAGVEPDQAVQMMGGLMDSLRETDPEYQRLREQAEASSQELAALRQEEYARVLDRDLRAIKRAYPDEKAKSVSELGEEFLHIMASGQVDAVSAYEAVRAHRSRMEPKPPSTGAIGGAASRKDGYYTKDEVAAMTPKQVHEHYDDIRKSMARWK